KGTSKARRVCQTRRRLSTAFSRIFPTFSTALERSAAGCFCAAKHLSAACVLGAPLLRWQAGAQISLAVRSKLIPSLLARNQRDELLRPGDRVAVAVSGGADSVALLLLLLELRDKLGVVVSIVHFNHKLRGKASDADEKFVAKLAAKHKLEFHSTSADVGRKAKRERANLEDAARRARYHYFISLVSLGVCT